MTGQQSDTLQGAVKGRSGGGRFPRVAVSVLLFVSLISLSSPINASWLEARGLLDPEDGMLDASDYLASAYGFLPVPIFITEPAIGSGLGLAVTYFHPQDEPDEPQAHPHKGPPSLTLGAGGYTENDTWFLAAGHQGIWKDDHLRYLGAVAYLSVNARFYGLNGGSVAPGPNSEAINRGLRFNSEGGLVYQQLRWRLGESDWWVGGHGVYSDIDNTFRLELGSGPPIEPPRPELAFNTTSAGLGLNVTYDGRNTTFTPSDGTRLELRYTHYDDWLGADFDYDLYETSLNHFIPVGDWSSLGLRLDFDAVSGDAPFFAYPFISLRGIPALRYQGEEVVTWEAEYLWGFTPRWSLALFGGGGRAYGDERYGDDEQTEWAGGVGIRYRLAKKFGLQGGFDIARGPEDTSFYITMGSAWR